MTKAGLQRGRFLAVVVVTSLLVLAAGSAKADEVPQWLDCFEDYVDTDALKMVWTFVGPAAPATLDLECDKWKACPNPWCDVHNSEGSAWEIDGCQYMRINYLVGTVAARLEVNPSMDFSDLQYLSFYYRGRFDGIANNAATLQLQLEGDGASTFYGPEVEAATICTYVPGMLECPWYEYKADISEWPGNVAINEIDIIVKDADRNGRLYIDCVNLYNPPVPVQPTSWGRIKSLYR